jgi:hypothetical protein
MRGGSLCAGLLLALCGCGGGGAAQAAKDAASIAAGAELAASLRASGAVPRVYAAQVAGHLRGELARARQAPGADTADDARLDGVLGEMERAAGRDDRAALRRTADRAGELARRLSDAAERLQAAEGGR